MSDFIVPSDRPDWDLYVALDVLMEFGDKLDFKNATRADAVKSTQLLTNAYLKAIVFIEALSPMLMQMRGMPDGYAATVVPEGSTEG